MLKMLKSPYRMPKSGMEVALTSIFCTGQTDGRPGSDINAASGPPTDK